MKKVERLEFIERIFGKEFVLPYRVCYNLRDIERAAREFESLGYGWGMRTDSKEGHQAAFGSPFIMRGNLEDAKKIWEMDKEKLIYIVSHNILRYHLNGVAYPIDDEHIFFEINDIDKDKSQRAMYDNPRNLKRFVIGPSRKYILPLPFPQILLDVFKPEDNFTIDNRLSEIYNIAVGRDIDEVTFSVREDDKKVVIW
jgi:hypothetical protein